MKCWCVVMHSCTERLEKFGDTGDTARRGVILAWFETSAMMRSLIVQAVHTREIRRLWSQPVSSVQRLTMFNSVLLISVRETRWKTINHINIIREHVMDLDAPTPERRGHSTPIPFPLTTCPQQDLRHRRT